MHATRRTLTNRPRCLAAAALLLAGCAVRLGAPAPRPPRASARRPRAGIGLRPAAARGGEVTLVTHDSFVVDEKMLADFEAVLRAARSPCWPRATPARWSTSCC